MTYEQKQIKYINDFNFVVENFNYFLYTLDQDHNDASFLQIIRDKCDSAIKMNPHNFECHLLRLTITKCQLIQTKKDEIHLTQQINDEYGLFYQFIIKVCRGNMYIDFPQNEAKIKFMVYDQKLTFKSFGYWNEVEFVQLFTKYYISGWGSKSIEHKASHIWKAIKLKLTQKQDVNYGINVLKQKLETMKTKQIQLNDDLNSFLDILGKISKFYAMIHGKEELKKKESVGIKDGIAMFSKTISSFPDEPYFYFMRAMCNLQNNYDRDSALKDLQKAFSLDINNGIFTFYIGFVEHSLLKKENAMKFYQKGWEALYKNVGQYYYHSLKSKIYSSFYKHAQRMKSDLFIEKVESNIEWKTFVYDLKNILLGYQNLINLFTDENKKTLSITEIHTIMDQKILNELDFYHMFEKKLKEWIQVKKYLKETDSLESLNGFLFEFSKTDETWNMETVLLGAMNHIFDLKKQFKEIINIRGNALLNLWLPSFHRILFNKYYDGHKMTCSNWFGKEEAKVIVDTICFNIKRTHLEFIDVEASTKQKDIAKDFDFKPDEKLLKKEEDFVKLEYSPLFDEKDRKNEELWKCITFAQKQKIPLIQYYGDAKYRFSIAMNGTNINHKRMRKMLFNQIDTPRTIDSDKYSLQKSFEFYEKFGSQTNELNSNIITKIDDSISIYFDYILTILETFKNKYCSSFPCQFDLYILPKNIVYLNDEKEDNDDEDEQKQQRTLAIDIEKLFAENNVFYIKKEGKTSFIFSVLFEWIMNEFLDKLALFDPDTPTRRRICFIIDRRRDNELFYIYQPPSKSYKFSKYDLSEIYFVRSSYSIIPILKDDPQSFGIFFTSFHFKQQKEIQIYQYWNKTPSERIGGRFFIEDDAKRIWKKYFTVQNGEDLGSETHKAVDEKFYKWINDKTGYFIQNGYSMQNK
eukprot:170626_1